jgi:two-component system NarL family response regulator
MAGERAEVGVVRILVAHSARLHRGAIAAALECERDLHVVAEADNAAEAVEACDRLQPDVAILDGHLPGYEVVKPGCAIKERNTQCAILVLADANDLGMLTDGLGCGARGYLTKDCSIAELVDAVRAVSNGETLIPPVMLGPLLSDLLERRRDHETAFMRMAELSSREREVLALVARGHTTAAIGETLVISPETARTHIQNILGKLGLHSRLEAATFVIENGLLDHLTPPAATASRAASA